MLEDKTLREQRAGPGRAKALTESMAMVLALTQCFLGTGGLTSLFLLALAHGAVAISQHPPGNGQAGALPVALSFHHPLVPVLGLPGLKTPRNEGSRKHLMFPAPPLPSLAPLGLQSSCPEAEPLPKHGRCRSRRESWVTFVSPLSWT